MTKLTFLLFFTASLTFADPITIPYTFSNGTPTDANEVNSNFTSLANGINLVVPYASASNTDAGSNNTLFGLNAGAGIGAAAARNVAVGQDALLSNLEGSDNTALGINALSNNTTANANTAIGAFAMTSNTIGYDNTAMGHFALGANSSGRRNAANGAYALADNTTGEHNTASGAFALAANTTGSFNTAVGNTVLSINESGKENTGVGSGSLSYNTIGNENMAVGNDALYSNTEGSFNSAGGRYALYWGTTGSYNTGFGYGALANNTGGTYNTAIGYGADVGGDALTNATAIGNDAKVDVSNKVRIGNGNVTVVEAEVALTTTSDRRLKENIQTTSLGLDFVNDLNPVQYHRINNQNPDIEMGIIAQELAATLETHNAGKLGLVQQAADGYMSVRYNDLLAPLIKAIQELSEENRLLASRINALEALEK